MFWLSGTVCIEFLSKLRLSLIITPSHQANPCDLFLLCIQLTVFCVAVSLRQTVWVYWGTEHLTAYFTLWLWDKAVTSFIYRLCVCALGRGGVCVCEWHGRQMFVSQQFTCTHYIRSSSNTKELCKHTHTHWLQVHWWLNSQNGGELTEEKNGGSQKKEKSVMLFFSQRTAGGIFNSNHGGKTPQCIHIQIQLLISMCACVCVCVASYSHIYTAWNRTMQVFWRRK